MRRKKKARYLKQVQENNFLESFPNINVLGQPGYRNSYGKSGLGYFETRTEMARMQGLFIRWMFTGKFRTHNPIYLLSIFLFSLFYGVFPLAGILFEIFVSKNFAALGILLFGFPYIAVAVALFVNVVLSIFDKNGKSITGD